MSWSHRALPEEVGERADVVLARSAEVTRTYAQWLLKNGHVGIEGLDSVKPSHRVEEGNVLAGEIPKREIEEPEAEDIPIDVRYSDERVLVVSKPPGLVTHPASGHHGSTLVNALLHIGGLAGEGRSIRPGIVHRLDKDTSGLLVVARDDAAQEFLVDALRERKIERRYTALVKSPMPAPSGTVDAPVGRHPTRRTMMAVVPGGRSAVTHYTVRAETDEVALLDIKLETGRTHQIRVHLAHLRRPVLGDRTYGGVSELSRRLGLTRPFLHAWRLAFPHPTDGRLIEVEEPLPADLLTVLDEADLPL